MYKDFTDVQVVMVVRDAAVNGFICNVVDAKRKLCGFILGKVYPDIKQLYITHCLCDTPESMHAVVRKVLELYSGWTIAASRHRKQIIYKDSAKLCRRLLRSHRTSVQS